MAKIPLLGSLLAAMAASIAHTVANDWRYAQYRPVGLQKQQETTWWEVAIYALTILQSFAYSCRLVVAFLDAKDLLQDILITVMWYCTWFIIHRSFTSAYAPRSLFLIYLSAAYVEAVDFNFGNGPALASISITSIAVSIALFLLDITNPVKDAHILEAELEEGRTPSLEQTASLFSLLTFQWVNPLLKLGKRRPLEQQDLPRLAHSDKMSIIIQRWNAYQ